MRAIAGNEQQVALVSLDFCSTASMCAGSKGVDADGPAGKGRSRPRTCALLGQDRRAGSVPVSRKPVDFCSSSTKPSAPLLNTITFTGSLNCDRLRRSPIDLVMRSPNGPTYLQWASPKTPVAHCDLSLLAGMAPPIIAHVGSGRWVVRPISLGAVANTRAHGV
jgi:hypothetical protein